MKTSSLLIIAVLGFQGLAGCETFNNRDKDTCGKRKLATFVGTSFDDLMAKGQFTESNGQMDDGSGVWKYKERTYFLRVFDPRTYLPGEDKIVLANYSAQRLNIDLTKDGIIEKFDCG